MQYQVKRINQNSINYVTPKKLDIFFKYIDWDTLYLQTNMGVRDEIILDLIQNKTLIRKTWLKNPFNGLVQILKSMGYPPPKLKGSRGWYSAVLKSQGVPLEEMITFTFVTEEGNYIEKYLNELTEEEWSFIIENRHGLVSDEKTNRFIRMKEREFTIEKRKAK